jgi:hypothetical protein
VLDEDGDGIADELQGSDEDYVKRKLFLLVKYIEPDSFQNACAGINSGVMAVLAALNIRAAKAISMGSSLGAKVSSRIMSSLEERGILLTIPEDFRKHVRPAIEAITKISGIMLALALAWFVQTVNSAMRGGVQFTDGALYYVVKHKYPPLLFALLDPDGDGKPNITPASPLYR